MNIELDITQAEILLRLIRGHGISTQESREVIGVELCLVDRLNKKEADDRKEMKDLLHAVIRGDRNINQRIRDFLKNEAN